MTKMKFTPPTEFPAEYVDGNGNKAVILGRGPNEDLPFLGYNANGYAANWTELGQFYIGSQSEYDLYDNPKRISTWHNIYDTWVGPQCSTRSDADRVHNLIVEYITDERLCFYRIERDADGGNPDIFVEEV